MTSVTVSDTEVSFVDSREAASLEGPPRGARQSSKPFQRSKPCQSSKSCTTGSGCAPEPVPHLLNQVSAAALSRSFGFVVTRLRFWRQHRGVCFHKLRRRSGLRWIDGCFDFHDIARDGLTVSLQGRPGRQMRLRRSRYGYRQQRSGRGSLPAAALFGDPRLCLGPPRDPSELSGLKREWTDIGQK